MSCLSTLIHLFTAPLDSCFVVLFCKTKRWDYLHGKNSEVTFCIYCHPEWLLIAQWHNYLSRWRFARFLQKSSESYFSWAKLSDAHALLMLTQFLGDGGLFSLTKWVNFGWYHENFKDFRRLQWMPDSIIRFFDCYSLLDNGISFLKVHQTSRLMWKSITWCE